MNLFQAREIASRAVTEKGLQDGRKYALIDGVLGERPNAWLFAFDSALFVETGAQRHRLLGNGPIYVDKRNGTVTFLGTYGSTSQVVDDFERRHGVLVHPEPDSVANPIANSRDAVTGLSDDDPCGGGDSTCRAPGPDHVVRPVHMISTK